MGLFSKDKKEEVPELPDLPEFENFPSVNDLPEVPAGLPKIETQTLPPLGRTSEDFGQQLIKNEIKTPQTDNKSFQRSQFAPLNQMPPQKMISPMINEPRAVEVSPRYYPPSSIKKAEPIFIRLDKFQLTVDTFEDIKNKIKDIEELLRATKEIKQKEERELEEWEKEIQIIKSRIESIDRDVFNKLD
ncbi:MAG: hypothetical protein WC438_02660 [Candidatus Pacearchaeota archaeon]